MDMKKILQALDGVSTKPVEGSTDMKKFVQIVNEGTNPHKVSLPVQMAMQHYQQPVEKKPSLLKKYFQEVVEIEEQQLAEKKHNLRMYSQQIAKRIIEKR